MTRPVDVVAALVWRDGRLLVTQRPTGSHFAGRWEFPGGKIEAGESPRAALSRELREELAIEVVIGSLRREIVHAYPDKVVRLQFFDCTDPDVEPEDLEVAAHRWVVGADLAKLDFPPADRELIEDLLAHFAPL